MKAVLLMAHGSIDSINDVEEFYTNIRRGRRPSDELIEELKNRYIKIGGKSPLPEVTKNQAARLEEVLKNSDSERIKVYVGMKYWHPYIKDTVFKMVQEGVKDCVAIALAPHYSKMSIGEYVSAVEAAQEGAGSHINFRFVKSWWNNKRFVDFTVNSVRSGLEKFPEDVGDCVHIIFTAHSLPLRILGESDPYPSEVMGCVERIVVEMQLKNWHVAYQSAGLSGGKWLGPDILEVIRSLAKSGVRNVLVCPVGFVSDHLEILYDLDIEARSLADSFGIKLERTDLPNDSDGFINVLASIVRGSLLNEQDYKKGLNAN